MCSISEPYGSISVANEMRAAGGPLISGGPSADTVLVSVSSSSVALLKLDDAKAIRFWFVKPSTPFTCTAIWDPVGKKILSASQGKVFAWQNSEKAEPEIIAECQSPVLSLLHDSQGVVVVCRNGLVFRLKYDQPNWAVQLSPTVKGKFGWCCVVGSEVILLAEDGKSVTKIAIDDSSSKTTVKAPTKFIISVCCLHDSTLFVGNSQGKVLALRGSTFEPSKIDLKMERSNLTGLISCDRNLIVVSETVISLWDVQFALPKATVNCTFTPWLNKCITAGDRALFANPTLMIAPYKVPKWSLASLVGSKKKSEKKTPSCSDTCESLTGNVSTWSTADILKSIHEIDDISESLVIRCWRRLLELNAEDKLILKLISRAHDCSKFTAILHESLNIKEVQESLDIVSSLIDRLTLAQLQQGRLECLMDWACHLVDAHKNALRYGLKSSESDSLKKSVQKLNASLQKVQDLSISLQDRQHDLGVFLMKSEEIRIPRERLYWTEPWDILNKI